MKIVTTVAAALAAALPILAPAAQAATLEFVSGTGQRSTTLGNVGGSIGQSFTAIDSTLTSIGFQFVGLNPNLAGQTYVLSLFAGETLTGTALATQTFTVPSAINSRTPAWFDIGIAPTNVSVNARYTAVLSASDLRNGVVFGPNINLNTGAPVSGDAYAGGRALFTTIPQGYSLCTNTAASICDLNLRVIGTTATPAVPEPAAWAMMLGGFGLLGAALRRRRTQITFA